MADPDLLGPLAMAERVGELVRIPSVNLHQAGPKSNDDGEAAMTAWLAERAGALGAVDVTIDEAKPGRENVYAHFPGESDHTITVDVHIDTVGVEHMTDDPFDGRIADGRVWGRGSVDTKASLAIVLSVLEELRAEGRRPTPSVNVVGTVAEEAGGLAGAGRYRDWLLEHNERIDQIIVAEPTLCRPVHGHKGALGLEVMIHGKAAHSSKPHLGANAISAAARVIAAIDAEHERLVAEPPTTPVGTGTCSVLMADGGVARNIIPPHCELFCGRRTAPGEDPVAIEAQLRELIQSAAAPLAVDIELSNGFASSGFWQNPESALVQRIIELAGTEPDLASFASNALRYEPVADEIVVFGPGSIDQAHQAVEWISIDEIVKVTDVYRRWFRS